MLRQRLAALIVASVIVLSVICAFSIGAAREQEKAPAQPPAVEAGRPNQKDSPQSPTVKEPMITATIDKLIAEYDLEPHPLPPIPDDPPPHEGAMISIPYVVEPSDMMIVEVLEALPGRPISGERLVKPDGTISLGFYGDIH